MALLRHLDLFSGIGGFSLAGQWAGSIETTQFVEINPECQKLLAKKFPGVPIHDDVSTFSASIGQFDLITAGFPCQDISTAGHQLGLDGKRSGLFFEVIRIIRECRPRYILLENVAALLSSSKGRDMGTVLWELSEGGYDAEWEIIPASALGANHHRERIWIIAYANSSRQCEQAREENKAIKKRRFLSSNKQGEECRQMHRSPELCAAPRFSDLSTFPRIDDGLSAEMD